MPGTFSNQPDNEPGRAAAPAADPPAERRVRITNIYATPWHLADGTGASDLTEFLRLWRLDRFYRLSSDQLPRVLVCEALDVSALRFQRWQHTEQVTKARFWQFRLPSGQIVGAFSLDVQCELAGIIDLLEDCYLGDIHMAGKTAEEYAHNIAVQLGAEARYDRGYLRHQVVFNREPALEESDDLVQRLIYRTDLPYRKEHSSIRYPGELNRRPGWLAAVGPYVSVICGHPDFIENAVFVSAVQAVGAAAQLRAIRQAAYEDVRLFRALEAAGGTTRDRRRTLERIADQLGDLELELSYSVEASADLGLLVPSLRVESFHQALYESMSLADKAVTAGRMLQRLEAAIGAELTAIESIERRADEHRRIRYAVAVGFVSAVAIPASLILAYLGINASQVNPSRSMFDHRYLGMYLIVAAVIVVAVAISAGVYVQQRRAVIPRRGQGERPPWTAVADQPKP